VLTTLPMLLELRCKLLVPLAPLRIPEPEAARSFRLKGPPPVLVLLPLLLVKESGLSGTSSVCVSSLLPVEFVAGGEGNPEPVSLLTGLGGSGRSGIEPPSTGGLVYARGEEDAKWAATREGLDPM